MRKRSIIKTVFALAVGAAVISLGFSSCTMMNLRGKNPEAIGAIAESSARLAKIITSEIPALSPKKRILEVGAGTGVFTEKLVSKLVGPYDHLDVVELMPELCEILKTKFGNHDKVTIYCGDILEWSPKEPYSYIVSGLPFNSFPADLVKKITQRYVDMAAPGAICSFFEYKWLSALRPLGMTEAEKIQFKATRDAIEAFVKRFEKFDTSVYINMPPAIVHFLQIDK